MPPFFTALVLAHLATTAFRALSLRCSAVSLVARAGPPFMPPLRPKATAAAFFLAMFHILRDRSRIVKGKRLAICERLRKKGRVKKSRRYATFSAHSLMALLVLNR